MGQMLEVTCADCGSIGFQGDGPLMTGFQPRCRQCGVQGFVSIMDLIDTDPPGIEPSSDEAWRQRYERVDTLAGTCECGGSYSSQAPMRCHACRSLRITSTFIGSAD